MLRRNCEIQMVNLPPRLLTDNEVNKLLFSSTLKAIEPLPLIQLSQLHQKCKEQLGQPGEQRKQMTVKAAWVRRRLQFALRKQVDVRLAQKSEQEIIDKSRQEKIRELKEQRCKICFLRKKGSIFNMIMLNVCLITSIMSNWAVQRAQNKFNSAYLLIAFGVLMTIWTTFIAIYGYRYHRHPQGSQEIQPLRVIDRQSSRRIQQICSIGSISLISFLMEATYNSFDNIGDKEIEYLQSCLIQIEDLSKRSILTQILLEKQIQNLQVKVVLLKDISKQLRKKTESSRAELAKMEDQRCLKCFILSYDTMFSVAVTLQAVVITLICCWVSVSPLGPVEQTWNITQGVFIIASVLGIFLFLQIVIRSCCYKPEKHEHKAHGHK